MALHPGAHERQGSTGSRGPSILRWIAYALLLGEVLVILVPSVYGRATPKLFGIPFFYWFQLLWIIVAMFVTGIAYLLMERTDTVADRRERADADGAQ